MNRHTAVDTSCPAVIAHPEDASVFRAPTLTHQRSHATTTRACVFRTARVSAAAEDGRHLFRLGDVKD